MVKKKSKSRLKRRKENRKMDKSFPLRSDPHPVKGFIKSEGKLYKDVDEVYAKWDKEQSLFHRAIKAIKQLFKR